MENVMNWVALALLAMIVAVLIGVLTTLPVMWLWNAVVPGIFGLKIITFWEALCLNLLASCFFKTMTSSSSK